MQFLARNFLLKRSIKPPKSQIFPTFWLFWHKSSKSCYNLHWHFDKKSCFVVVLVLKDWISTVQSNFLSQKLSVECNFFFKWVVFAFLAFLAFLARNWYFFSLSREKWKVRENPRYTHHSLWNSFSGNFMNFLLTSTSIRKWRREQKGLLCVPSSSPRPSRSRRRYFSHFFLVFEQQQAWCPHKINIIFKNVLRDLILQRFNRRYFS